MAEHALVATVAAPMTPLVATASLTRRTSTCLNRFKCNQRNYARDAQPLAAADRDDRVDHARSSP
jgi:hypothetical protein